MASQNNLENQLRLAGIDVESLLWQMASQNVVNKELLSQDTQPSESFYSENTETDHTEEHKTSNEGLVNVFDPEIFIEELRQLPCLWNTSLSSYKDRNVKTNAWKKLEALFNKDSEYNFNYSM